MTLSSQALLDRIVGNIVVVVEFESFVLFKKIV